MLLLINSNCDMKHRKINKEHTISKKKRRLTSYKEDLACKKVSPIAWDLWEQYNGHYGPYSIVLYDVPNLPIYIEGIRAHVLKFTDKFNLVCNPTSPEFTMVSILDIFL